MMISKYGKFLTLKEFQNNFEIKVNHNAFYFQLIAAITPDLIPRFLICLLYATTEYCHMEVRTIVLTKFRRRESEEETLSGEKLPCVDHYSEYSL